MSHVLDAEAIDARLARYAASGDARDLWPDVTAAEFGAAQAAIAAATAALLAGQDAALDAPAVTPRAMGVAASAGGMGPLLGWWCEAGKLRAEPVMMTLLAVHLEHGRRRAALLTGELNRVVVAFARRGITPVVLKGMETAHRYFPDPGTRPCADIDLLVRPEDAPAAGAALAELGFTGPHLGLRQRATWYPAGAQRVVALDVTHERNPWAIDLHTQLDRFLLRGIAMPAIVPDLAACEPVQGFAAPVLVLPPALKLMYLALHTSSHFSAITLVRLVELVLLARAEFIGRPDRWDEMRDLMRRYQVARVTYPALALADRLAPGVVNAHALRDAEQDAGPRLRAAVRRRSPATAQRLHPMPRFDGLRWARTPGEVLVSLTDLVWPFDASQRRMSPREVVAVYRRRAQRLLAAARKLAAR